MKIAVSACLLGHNCKYSGGNNRSQKVLDYIEGHEVIPVCPEVSGGMPADCIGCGKCEEACPQNLKIRQLLTVAAEEL